MLLLRRQPRLWWALVGCVALTAGWGASTVVASAERTRAAWGRSATVLVVERGLQAGDPIGPGDVSSVPRPQGTVPDGAVAALPDGAVARIELVPGEVLLDRRIAPLGLRGIAAALPIGTRAVAIPAEPGLVPPLMVGDRVDVLVAVAPEAAGAGPPGFTVAEDALVVAVDEAAVTIAVARAEAPRIAVALGQAAVMLALIGA
ncbi:MAG: SAF domain-containing protein [Acidimicrobiales bacterium]